MRLILDDFAKEKVITIMAFGGTRQMAAAHLNCHPRTISNAEKRDPKFAEDLRKAYSNVELALVNTLVRSAQDGTAHSAKWLLERLNPDKFGKRKAGCYTPDMVQGIFSGLAETIVKLAPSDSHRDFALQVLTDYGKEQLIKNEPFMEDCVPLYRSFPDYVEEARKYREEEYARIDAEEEIAYQEYEAQKAADAKAAQAKKAKAEQEQAVAQPQAQGPCEIVSTDAAVAAGESATKSVKARAADAKKDAHQQVVPAVKRPKLSKSARKKQYEAAKRAAAAETQPTPPREPDSPEPRPLKPLPGGLDSTQP